MSEFTLRTPVALFIFNRPDTTAKVFAEIARAKPSQLFIVADGPRGEKAGDVEKCSMARSIVERIDWECDVYTNFSATNLGCKVRVSTGLDWVFENVEQAIILEDDCMPHPSFFRFCEEMLEHYRHDERVMQICGSNVLLGWKRSVSYSYYFSKYGPIWGWATWRRAWKHYDVNMKLWPNCKSDQIYEDFCMCMDEVKHRISTFDKQHDNKIDTWDHQWVFAKLINSGLCITPTNNLISNIGFREDATHTTHESELSSLPVSELKFPLKHPPYVIADSISDRRYCKKYFVSNSVHAKIFRKVVTLLHG